jgi:hypothetical protein
LPGGAFGHFARRTVNWNRMMAATLIGFTGFAVRGQTPGLPAFPALWDSVFTLRAGAGYKDNVFLAHADPQGSAFVSGGAEAMVLRLAPSGPQFSFFANAEANRFFSLSPAHDEYTAFSQAQLEHDFGETARGAVAAQYFYQDQVLDISISETNREAAAVRGHTLTLRPEVRLALPRQFWLSFEAYGTRQFFERPLDDYWEASPKLALGHSYGHDSQVSLSYAPSWRFYDSDPARTSSGEAIPDSLRRRFEQETRLTWRHSWDAEKHWRTTATLGARLNQENGGGYSDYTRWFAAARLHYRAKPWELSAEGRLAQYDYATQTVSATDLSKRRRTEVNLALRLERHITRHAKLVAAYEYERTLSNDRLETYSVNTFSGSVHWEF